jgi:NADH:ubiquinone oxidoreductase subunit E
MSKFHSPDKILYVCVGSKCSKKGGKELCKTLKPYVKHHKDQYNIEVIKTECTDRCKFAPVLSIQPDNIWLKEYTERTVLETLAHLWKL